MWCELVSCKVLSISPYFSVKGGGGGGGGRGG